MSFYTETLQPHSLFHSTETVRDIALLEPITRNAVQSIIAEAALSGTRIFVTETYRSSERQAMLFASGATKLKDVGVHHYGLAADFAKMIDGKASWDGSWDFLGNLALRYGLVWGGNWGSPAKHHTFVDSDHVQRINLEDQPKLFSGLWFPDITYKPFISGAPLT